MRLLPMSMSPSPSMRSSGLRISRSLLRATPLATWKLTDISLNSVFSVSLAFCAWFWPSPIADFALPMALPRLMPLTAPFCSFMAS